MIRLNFKEINQIFKTWNIILTSLHFSAKTTIFFLWEDKKINKKYNSIWTVPKSNVKIIEKD
jgi:hypothetical protein